MAKRKTKKAATRKRSTKKTTRKTSRRKTAASNAQLDTAYAQGVSEVAAINDALAQAQSAQESLAAAYDELHRMEEQLNEEHEEALAALESEREELRVALDEAQREDTRHTKELNGAFKSLRGISSALTGIADPLLPLTDDDDDGDLPLFREQLSSLVGKKGSETLDSLPVLQDALQAGRDLADVLAARVKLQSNRMKAARKDLETLEDDRAALEGDVDNYASQQEQLREQLADSEAALQEAENNIQQLQEDLEAAQSRCALLEEQGAESEEAHVADQEALQQELDNAVGRAEELSKKLKDSRELARKTERATVDLAEVVLQLADADAALPQVADLPPVAIARDELESLIGDAGDDWDDEVDNLFRDDLGDDIASAARHVADSLTNRSKALVSAMQASTRSNVSLQNENQQQELTIGELESSMQELESALNRSTAQLESVTREVEQLSAELSDRHKEINEAHGEIARMTSANETLNEKAILAEQLQQELKTTAAELANLQKLYDKLVERSETCDTEQRRLARSLVDLAGAAESALSMSGGKSQSRFTKTYRKLDDVAAQSDADTARVIKTSLDVVDKLSTRVSQLTHEVTQQNETIADFERYADDLEKQLEKESQTLNDRESTLKTLKLDNQDLNKEAKRAAKLEDQLVKSEAAATKLGTELKEARERLDDTEADLEAALAREEETRESLFGELSDLKRRLNDEQKSRRATEMSLSDDRDDYESQVTTLQTTVEELTRNLEERDDHIIELQSELDDAGEQRARIAELEHRAETFKADLEEALARNRQLEGELDNQEAVETLEEELREAHDERDELISKVRELEKQLADEKGKAASARSMNETLSKKLEDKANMHRREVEQLQERYDTAIEESRRTKVKLAGMNARRRTTSNG